VLRGLGALMKPPVNPCRKFDCYFAVNNSFLTIFFSYFMTFIMSPGRSNLRSRMDILVIFNFLEIIFDPGCPAARLLSPEMPGEVFGRPLGLDLKQF
jgi:hypothetical protein